MKTKATSRFLAALMALTMLLSCSAMAADVKTDSPDEQTLISLSEDNTVEVTVSLSPETLSAVKNDLNKVTWTLVRTDSYANPDAGLIPLLGESEMYPNELDTIDLNKVPEAYQSYLNVQSLKTSLGEGSLTMTLTTAAMTSRGNPSVPHANGGSYLDVCGSFDLVASLKGQEIARQSNVLVKPYATFHTMWEIYAELDRLAGLGDDNDKTAKPYVVKKSMGKSNLGYDMPYLIVAKDSNAVQNWLDLCERAETDPEGLQADIKAKKLNYQVPVLYSNIHSNEVAAADGILEFAKLLVEEDTIDYKKLTDLTQAGQEKLAEQREALGLHTSKLIEDMTTFLGGILPDASVTDENQIQKSGQVPGFDTYYTSETDTVKVDDLLDNVFFILVPEENVEGRMYVTRYSSGGYDLNRDNSFQTQAETQNMQNLIGTYNPVTLLELHGQVVGFQVEPCSPPHEPNFEYDLLSNYLLPGGEAFGAAAVANNDLYQSYVCPMRDYLTSDEQGNPDWTYPWDDMSTSYTPQFAMLQGCVSYTVELPAYSDATSTAACYGLLGLSDYVADNKDGYFSNQLEIYARCLNNEDTDDEVGPWLVDAADNLGAEADLFRPAYDGKGENGQFFPECYIIPLDSANQNNLQAAYDMVEWLTRNDVKVGITDKAFTYDGVTYPAGTMVVSMYQAKRAVANGVLYQGTVIQDWNELYSEGITAFNYTRGFDMATCAQPAAYKTIAAAVGTTLDYQAAQTWLKDNAKTQFSGAENGSVILSNASEDAVSAVNALLKAGKTVGMVTEGQYEGDFICSYKDYLTVKDAYVLTATGVVDGNVTAYVIEKAPTVYISGTAAALTPSATGYVNTPRITNQAYNYDRMAMELMNFNTTTDAAKADAVIGANALDASGLAAVQAGTPYIGYTKSAVSAVSENLVSLATGSTDGMDCLGFVTYPEKTLTNASYINDGDNVFYGYGTSYFTSLPVGSKILVQGDGSAPMEGFLNGDDASLKAFLSGVKGFSYEGKDMKGNDVNLTLFANSLTNKAHQRDEYAFISNTIFANLLTGTRYGSFADVPADAYYADAVAWAVENGITTGTSATTFSPDADCTRAQTVTFLWRAAGCPEPTVTENPFSDVKTGDYYYDAVLWAMEWGITTGTSATTFSPNATVSRGQTVTFLWRQAGSPVAEVENPFTDVAADAYYADATTWAVECGITTGMTKTTFGPDNNCTRAQIVTFLWRDCAE
ncbi:MAG: M14 family metallopeptidase [Bacillota bacterium]|nr:M14 family metallopeptidase [Bacillota bacterium]